MKPKVLVIVGPTASGKSALGVELAKAFNGEVISADSRQVYKGLNIGTGKITEREMKGVPHHLLDVASPKRAFSAGDFVRLARKKVSSISRRGNLPIVVGGTGFYIDALVGRIALPAVEPDPRLRARLQKKTAAELYALLLKKDPDRAKTLDSDSERNNKVRLIRAIEIASALGRVPPTRIETPYEVLWIGVKPSDTQLKQKIRVRLSQRIKKGMVAEAKQLAKSGLSLKRMEELGLEYRSLARHLKGAITKVEMERELQSDIWRYARKQIGYWKRNDDIRWFTSAARKKIESSVRAWLRK